MATRTKHRPAIAPDCMAIAIFRRWRKFRMRLDGTVALARQAHAFDSAVNYYQFNHFQMSKWPRWIRSNIFKKNVESSGRNMS
jgi:hypothetical protein